MIKLLDMMVPKSSGFQPDSDAPGGVPYSAVKKWSTKVCMYVCTVCSVCVYMCIGLYVASPRECLSALAYDVGFF